MTPFSTRNDVANRGFGYSKNSGKPDQANAISRVQKPHFLNLNFGKSGSGIFTSVHWRQFVPFRSTFFHHILRVVFRSSAKQMCWVAAWRVVAFMKNPKAIWNWAIGNFKSNSMSLKTLSHNCENSMPIMSTTAGVRPTSIITSGFVNVLPNVCFDVWFAHIKENARQLGSKVRNVIAATKSAGVNNRFTFFSGNFDAATNLRLNQ